MIILREFLLIFLEKFGLSQEPLMCGPAKPLETSDVILGSTNKLDADILSEHRYNDSYAVCARVCVLVWVLKGQLK